MSVTSKKLLSLLVVMAMVLGMVPAFTLPAMAADEHPATTAIEAGEAITCPTCGPIAASEWQAVESRPAQDGFSGGHYYLKTNINYSGSNASLFTISSKVCIHLNGYNVSQKNTSKSNPEAFLCNSGGELTIMGSGIVTVDNAGNYSGSGTGAVAAYGGTVHLYGGTYVAANDTASTTKAALMACGDTGILNVYEGAEVAQGEIMQHGNSKVYIHGGSFQGFSTSYINSVGNAANVVVTGGTFKADPDAYTAYNCITHDEAEGTWTVNAENHDNETVTEEPASCTEDGHSAGSTCKVCGVSDVQIYTATGHDWAQNPDGSWVCQNNCGLAPDASHPLDFQDDVACAHGCEVEEWIALDGTVSALEDGKHYYLAKDITSAITVAAGSSACLHLNGYSLEAAESAAITANGSLNVMGSGTVSGSGTAIDDGAIYVDNSAAVVNLYSGTYTRAAGTGDAPIVYVGANGGTVNMKTGVTIDAEGLTNTNYSTCVYLVGAEGAKAEFNMEGGQIKGGSISANSKYGGAVYVGVDANSNAEFNMEDGTISGGKVNPARGRGGNVFISAGGVMNMSGGEIIGTGADVDAAYYGGNVYIVTGSLNMSGDAKIYDGHANTQGGNIYNAGGSLSMSGNAEIYNGISDGRGGNIRAYTSGAVNCQISMSGNAKIYGGKATSEENLWIANTDMVMKDDAIVRGAVDEESGNGVAGSAIRSTTSLVVLDGNATVANENANSNNIIYCDKLMVTKDWTGEATIYLGENVVGTTIVDGVIVEATGFCGTYNYETGEATIDTTDAGTFAGNLYYMSKRPIYGKNGRLHVAEASVVTAAGTTLYSSVAEAIDNCGEGAYLKALNNLSIALDGEELYMDANGMDITFTGNGTVYPMDGSNDDFDGYGSWTVAEGENVTLENDVTNPINGNRYITVSNTAEVANTFRIKMRLSKVTLRPSTNENQMGIYYKATISCDDALAELIDSYGVVVSKIDMPHADFWQEQVGENGFTVIEDKLAVDEQKGYVNEVQTNSGAVFGIMKTTKAPEVNVRDGETPLYANAYLAIDVDGDQEEEYFMADNNTDETDDIAWSLFRVMEAINTDWENYDAATVQTNVAKFYKHWAPLGMSDWEDKLSKIAAAAAAL